MMKTSVDSNQYETKKPKAVRRQAINQEGTGDDRWIGHSHDTLPTEDFARGFAATRPTCPGRMAAYPNKMDSSFFINTPIQLCGAVGVSVRVVRAGVGRGLAT
ncbi:hypothetical protein J6590_029171 [Homalodisca vitripennis]|nr:hypothetical protein J6590_029171 [Homalodisca vitripennis]